MAAIPNPLSLSLSSIALPHRIRNVKGWDPANHRRMFFFDSRQLRSKWVLSVRASGDSLDSGDARGIGNRAKSNGIDLEKSSSVLRGVIGTLPVVMKRNIGSKLAIGLYISFVLLGIASRQIMLKKQSQNRHGSVNDLVKRGQIRSDRRGISNPFKYEDPFNNPFVKVGKSNSTIEMCGKVYHLAPVSLTKEQQTVHQKRRSRAYEWKRPTIFLKEGDSIPTDADPDTVRWIPANHPFATTVSDIGEDLAQNNVFKTHGVPFRIKAEHEAMQKRLEALQNDQKLNKVETDASLIYDFERPFKPSLKPSEPTEPSSSTIRKPGERASKFDQDTDSSDD